MRRRVKRSVLAFLDRIQPWAAWTLLIGAAVVFLGVIFNVLATGDAKWATILVSADLLISGYGEVQKSADEDEDSP